MGVINNGEGFELLKCATIDHLYFYNQNPLTVLREMKDKVMKDIESMFDDTIERS